MGPWRVQQPWRKCWRPVFVFFCWWSGGLVCSIYWNIYIYTGKYVFIDIDIQIYLYNIYINIIYIRTYMYRPDEPIFLRIQVVQTSLALGFPQYPTSGPHFETSNVLWKPHEKDVSKRLLRRYLDHQKHPPKTPNLRRYLDIYESLNLKPRNCWFPQNILPETKTSESKKTLGRRLFLLRRILFRGELSFRFRKGTPQKINGWNLRIRAPWKMKIIFQTIIFRFYVNLRGCSVWNESREGGSSLWLDFFKLNCCEGSPSWWRSKLVSGKLTGCLDFPGS